MNYLKIKYLAFATLCFLSFYSWSQSMTSKYNSLYKRYEYFDSDGQMVGYKQWNSLHKQWEYFDSSSNKRKTDYGNYVSPIDLGLVSQALTQRQKRYNSNVQKVKNHLSFIYDGFDNLNSQERTNMAYILFQKRMKSFFQVNNKLDYSSNNIYNQVISRITDIAIDVVEEVSNID